MPRRQLYFIKRDSGFYGQYQITLQVLNRQELIVGEVLKREIYKEKYEDTKLLNSKYLDSLNIDFSTHNSDNPNFTTKIFIHDLNSNNAGETQFKLALPQVLGRLQFYKNHILNLTHVYSSDQNKADSLNIDFEINSSDVRSCSLWLKKESGLTTTTSGHIFNKTKSNILRKFLPFNNTSLTESTSLSPSIAKFSYFVNDLSGNGQYKITVSAYDINGQKIATTEDFFTIENSFFNSDIDYSEMVNRLLYIATESEMKKLRDCPAKERESLWNTFWKEHNQNPITETNETEEEYFARIDYCITNFSKGDNGYKSDRARIYMKYGPPDFIESRPFDQYNNAYEIWNYYHLGVQFTFVDYHGFGKFILYEEGKL
jgi:GWxTD domain-containing protein